MTIRHPFLKFAHFLLHNKSNRQTVAKNTFWLTASNLTSRALRLLIIVYAARVLGTSSWGAFSYITSIAGFFVVFSDLGINPWITRESARSPNLQDSHIATAIVLRCVLLFLFSIVFIIAIPLFPSIPERMSLVIILTAVTVFDSLRDIAAAIVRGIEKIEIEAQSQIITNSVIAILGFFFLLAHPTNISLALAYLIATIVGTVSYFFSLKKLFYGLFRFVHWSAIPSIVRMALPFSITALMVAIMTNTDTILIGMFRSIHDVGLYSAIQRLIQTAYLIPGLIVTPLFPLMSRVAQHDQTLLKKIVEKSIHLIILLSLPLVSIGMTYAREIIDLVYGSDYREATVSFGILALSILFYFIYVVTSTIFYSLNDQRAILTLSIIGVMSTILLDILLIPRFGIGGAAISATATMFLISLYTLSRIHKTIQGISYCDLTKTIGAGIGTLGITLLFIPIQLPFIFEIALIMLFYFLLLILSKNPIFKEIRLIFS